MDLIVRNGTVVTAGSIGSTDIGISDGRVVQIGGTLPDALETIDAAGKYIFPGGVDVHTHLDATGAGFRSADNFLTGTEAAASGGTTTIIDFCQQEKGNSLAASLDFWHELADKKAVVDYGFHIIITDLTPSVHEELAALPEAGVTSFKIFLAYRGAQMVDDVVLLKTLEIARRNGALVMVHAENGDAADFLTQRHIEKGEVAPKYHAASRPPRVEAEATARAIALAEVVGAPIYIVHITCRESLEEVVRGRLRGVEVVAETCTHYLYTTAADLDRPDFEGAKFVFTPPPRSPQDQVALRHALANDALQVISSDHGGWSFKNHKMLGRNDFTKIPNGIPGVEERMLMAYQGVVSGLYSLNRFVEITSTNPAKLFGLFPKKGTIAVGSDADLVIWDPDATGTVRNENLHHAVDFSVYEGQPYRGRVVDVFRRGERIVRNGEFIGTPGSGQFLKRNKYVQRRG